MNASLTALRALIRANGMPEGDRYYSELESLFMSRDPFLAKVKQFDKITSTHPATEVLAEYAFDLLMNSHLEEHQDDEDYFDTKEWLDIEDHTLERGTELLNILLYLTEGKDNDVNIELGDFLNEFLLIEEDEFQDEYKIYEELIANAELIEEDPNIIIETAARIEPGEELKELFTPLLLFFSQPNKALAQADQLPDLQRSLYHALIAYNNS